jgi:hypothetical protein
MARLTMGLEPPWLGGREDGRVTMGLEPSWLVGREDGRLRVVQLVWLVGWVVAAWLWGAQGVGLRQAWPGQRFQDPKWAISPVGHGLCQAWPGQLLESVLLAYGGRR